MYNKNVNVDIKTSKEAVITASIKDVASLTGVSIATVSRVINHSPKVSEGTRRSVEQAIKSLGYHPNFVGRNLQSSVSMKILVLLPTIENTFYSDILVGAGAAAAEEGYQLIIGVTQNKAEIEASYIEMLRSRQVDGIILANTSMDKYELSRLAETFPITLVGHTVEGAEVSSVSIDNEQAAAAAVSMLIGLGHTRIGMISGFFYQNPSTAREAGYRSMLEQAGLPFESGYLVRTDFNFKSGYQACKKLVSLKKPPTALFCIADSMGIGALKYLIEEGLDSQISVFGFDNVLESEYFHHGLTTINQPKQDLGRISVELLLEKIRDSASPTRYVEVPYSIIERGSTHKL